MARLAFVECIGRLALASERFLNCAQAMKQTNTYGKSRDSSVEFTGTDLAGVDGKSKSESNSKEEVHSAKTPLKGAGDKSDDDSIKATADPEEHSSMNLGEITVEHDASTELNDGAAHSEISTQTNHDDSLSREQHFCAWFL